MLFKHSNGGLPQSFAKLLNKSRMLPGMIPERTQQNIHTVLELSKYYLGKIANHFWSYFLYSGQLELAKPMIWYDMANTPKNRFWILKVILDKV